MKQMKLSRYLVKASFLQSEIQKILVLSTRSGVLRAFDFLTWTYLEEKRWDLLAKELLQELAADFFIVKENEDEFKTILHENMTHINTSGALYKVLQPTAYCPLGCDYCGQVHHPKLMRPEIQEAILLRTGQELSAHSYQSLRIGWFGGEPLSGIKVIEELTPKFQTLCRERNVVYDAAIVTNGLLLTEYIAQKLIHELGVGSFEITLDGTAEFHDQRRHTKNFGKTFDKIYANLLRLVEQKSADIKVSIRCNVDERNQEGVDGLIEKLAQDGLHQHIYFYVASVYSWGNDAHQLSLARQEFADREIEWLVKMQQLGFKRPNCYLPARKKMVCMTVNPSSSLIDPFGSIFHCTEVSLVPTYERAGGKHVYQAGHILSSQANTPQVDLRGFYKDLGILEYECPSCVMFPTCGGGCPKQWKEGHIPCPATKYNIQKRMILEYLQR